MNARTLLAQAIHEARAGGCPHYTLLATPSGQKLAAIVDAAVAYVGAQDAGLDIAIDHYRDLFAAVAAIAGESS